MEPFKEKQTSLVKHFNATDKSVANKFVKAALEKSAETISGNGALKYSTSGNAFVDNFANAANFKTPRSFEEVAKDMQLLWSIDKLKCVQLAMGLRIVTRKTEVVLPKQSKKLPVQRGQGLKNEGIMRMLWLAIYHKPVFVANLPYFIAAGSWKDVFTMMSLDLEYHGWKGRKLDWNFMTSAIIAGLINPRSSDLVKKYLPSIKVVQPQSTVAAQAKSILGKFLASRIYTYLSETGSITKVKEPSTAHIQRVYRKVKSSGSAHIWQQLISQEKFLDINFNTISGRALALLVGSKFLKNQGLEEVYTKWIESQPVAKFTGYVFELFKPFGNYITSQKRLSNYREATINAQFNGLIQTAKSNIDPRSKLLTVIDISGSMESEAAGTSMSSYLIAKAIALYFSSMFEGPFKDIFAVFANKCEVKKWVGETPVDKWINEQSSAYGSTNLESVAEMLVMLKNSRSINENEFPAGVLLISDGEFNRTANNTSNFYRFRQILRDGGFSINFVNNFKLILWDIPNNFYESTARSKFEDFADTPNVYYLSGYDPSIISFVLGTPQQTPANATELFEAAMDQDLLQMVTIPKFTNKKPINKNKKNENKHTTRKG